MKTNKICIIILALILVTLQSCKKDKDANPVSRNDIPSSLNIYEEKNLDEYLTNFMDKIKTATRSSESLTTEDAMWHLSACLNFKYCNTNVYKSQVEYDTIVTSINVNNGYISLNDINTSLNEISDEVCAIYSASKLENKNLLCIMPEIQDNNTRGGATVRTIVVISNILNFGNYYFSDEESALSLFPEYVSYAWNTDAVDLLEYYMNMLRPETVEIPGRVYITNATTVNCYYRNYYYRLYSTKISDHTLLNREDMAYFLDSYLGLIYECNPGRPLLSYVCSNITAVSGDIPQSAPSEPVTFHHTLDITYGVIRYTNTPTPPMD